MKDVYLNVQGKSYNKYFNTVILFDDKRIKYKINRLRQEKYHYQTDKDVVNIKILSYTQMHSKWWYFISIFYFFISFFGIFDIRPNKKGYSISVEYNFNLSQENVINLGFNMFSVDSQAVNIQTDLSFEEVQNICYTDSVIAKRYKITKIIRLVILLLSILLAISALIFLIVYYVV